MSSGNELPDGWALTRIELCTEFVTSGSRGWARYYSESGARFIRVGDFKKYDLSIDLDNTAHVKPPQEAEGKRTSVLPGDVLITITADVGMVAVAGAGLGESYVNQHVALLRPIKGLSGRCFAYGLLDPKSLQKTIRASQYGATKPGLSLIQVRGLEVKIPPRPEQDRIVEALDSYLTRLDAAAEGLKRVEASLERYRASVLKAAVEGRLVPTEAELARQEGRDYEPASVLLERILEERRRRWEEAELAKMEAKGKTPKSDKWKAKYKEPVAPDLDELPELPEGWAWATVDQIGEVQGGIQKGKKRSSDAGLSKVPYLRVANVQRGFLDLEEVKEIQASDEEIRKLKLEHGDVLFNEGGDRDKLGRGWVWRNELKLCIHQNHVFRVRLFTDDVLPELLSWYGNSVGQQYFFKEGKQTTNLASINSTKLRSLPVPIAPKFEQNAILRSIDELLSISDASRSTTGAAQERIQRLRQAILKWAFEGKLVDQDPNDEPASALLEKIRAERKDKGRNKP